MQSVKLTLNWWGLYKHWDSVEFNTVGVKLTLTILLCGATGISEKK